MTTPTAPAGASLDFGRAFSFVFADPDWVKKVLIGGAFALLSALLVGVPFVVGYQVRVVRRTVRGEPRPLPEWTDFGGLFSDGLRGLAVYLGHLVVAALPAAAGGCLLALVAGSIGAATPGETPEALGALVGFGAFGLWAVAAVLMLAFQVYVPAALLRFALLDRVGAAFQVGENVALIKRNLGNYVLSLVVYLLASLVAQLGVLLCFVGVFPFAFWALCVLGFCLGEVARRDPALIGQAVALRG